MEKPLRVLQVGKFYHPFMGGIETVLRHLSEGLVRRGVQVTVLCAGDRMRETTETINGVKVVRLGCLTTLLSQPICPKITTRLLELSKKADIIHVHSPNPLAEWAVITLPAQERAKVVCTYHSDVVRQKFLKALYLPVLQRFLGICGKIMVSTPLHLEYSAALKAFKEKCEVIPFGIDESPFQLSPSILEKVAEIRSDGRPILLFTGRMVGYKGVTYLLEAMTRLDARLVLIGVGPNLKTLMKEATRRGLSERVTFLGRVADPEWLAAYFHSCDIFVLPSISANETFGLAMLEAMSCGKPVVSTELDSGVKFVNKDGVSGLQVSPRDSVGLSDAINSLLKNRELRLSLGQGARRRFEECFSNAAMIESSHRVYEQTRPAGL